MDRQADSTTQAGQQLAFSFTGTGSDYFKVWIVNLFLSIVTLGVYSAWATVRRLQYFHSHTQLAGAAFNFDANPKTLLGIRLLAVATLLAYLFAFDQAHLLLLAASMLVLIAVPLLLRSWLKFRLDGSTYRGLRFGFTGTARGAYAYSLCLLIFLLPPLLGAIEPRVEIAMLITFVSLLICSPLLHGAMRRYVHHHLRLAGMASCFEAPNRLFYIPVLKALVALLLTLANLAAMVTLVMAARVWFGWSTYEIFSRSYASLAVGLVTAFVVVLFAGPYRQMLTDNLCWSATRFPGVRIASRMKAGSYLRLQLINSLLTVLSCGLYRPFAVVSAYRYRLENISVTIDDSARQAQTAPGAHQSGHCTSVIARSPRYWPAALVGMALLAAGVVAFAQWGMPALAERVVATLPAAIDKRVGDAAEHDLITNASSILSDAEIEQLCEIARQVAPQKTRMPLRVIIVSRHPMRAASFALPNGTIVITDDLLMQASGRDAFARIIAHEIGHIEGRHAMQAVLSGSPKALLSALFSGDFSDMVASKPEMVLDIRYSPEQEAAASKYASERMRQLGWPVAPLAPLYDALEREVKRDERGMPAWMAEHPSYLRTHARSKQHQ